MQYVRVRVRDLFFFECCSGHKKRGADFSAPLARGIRNNP
jgi:hypothetical protein